jgi:Amino acid permease
MPSWIPRPSLILMFSTRWDTNKTLKGSEQTNFSSFVSISRWRLTRRNREMGFIAIFSVSFSMLGLLPSIASVLSVNLAESGPAGALWSWLFAGVLIQAVVVSMAELASSMPTNGGLYYAAAQLAPKGYGPLAAWVSPYVPNADIDCSY